MIEINLLKQLQKETGKSKRKSRIVFGICFLAILLVATITATLYFSTLYLSGNITNQKEELKNLEEKEEKLTEIRNMVQNLQDVEKDIKATEKKGLKWSAVLKELADLTPARVSLDKIAPEKSGGEEEASTYKVEGSAKTRRDIALFMDRLEKSENFKDVKMTKSTKLEGLPLAAFEIKLTINTL